MSKLAAVTFALALAWPAAAADPDARAKLVAPFLDEQTLAVGYLDVTRVDPNALAAWLAEVSKVLAKELDQPRQLAGQWLTAFSEAGGKELVTVVSLADLPEAPVVLVPLEKDADVRALTGLLGQLSLEKSEVRGQVLVAGTKKTMDRLRALKPAQRPEVAEALTHAGDTALQVVLVPPADLRRAYEELVPTLPQAVGGGSITPLTRDLRWATFSVNLPPKMSLLLRIQCSAGRAKAVNDTLSEALKALGEMKELRQDLPEFAQMVALLTLQVKDDQLMVNLDAKDLTKLLQPIARKLVGVVDRDLAQNSLKNIGLAMHNYHDVYGHFPAAASYDKQGRPLLSWRVHILPYLEQEELYKQFHLDEPWDSEHNKKLLAKMPRVYAAPPPGGAKERFTTLYQVFTGKGAIFEGKKGLTIKQISDADGTANTILVAEASEAVPWTKPQDLPSDPDKPLPKLGAPLADGFNLLFADGSVRYIRKTTKEKTLRALITWNGGESISSSEIK
jgi:prepilin-type processing-associated H-X9-DG protein